MNSKISVYVHRTHKMKRDNKVKFQKKDRPRIEIRLRDKKPIFIYADQFMDYIINSFEYGED